MTQYSKPQRGDYLKSILFITVYVLAIGIGAVYLLPERWYIWAGIVLVGLVLLIWWHKSSTAYRCPGCGHEFEISFLVDLVSPHGVTREGPWLLLRCPACHKWGKATVLRKDQPGG